MRNRLDGEGVVGVVALTGPHQVTALLVCPQQVLCLCTTDQAMVPTDEDEEEDEDDEEEDEEDEKEEDDEEEDEEDEEEEDDEKEEGKQILKTKIF